MNQELNRRLAIRNQREFHSTNQPWNLFKLNTSWVIGSLNFLFKQSQARSWEEWQAFYYASGEERKRQLQSLSKEKVRLLSDITIPFQRKRHLLDQLSQQEQDLNVLYGRTVADLEQIGNYFHAELLKKGHIPNVKRHEANVFVKIRVIDETFIGFERERKTIEEMKSIFPQLRFADISYHDDVLFAIDTEVYLHDRLLCAIQVKSLSYMATENRFVHGVKRMNTSKNDAYVGKFGVPVLYAYSDAQGTIHNTELFQEIRLLASKAS